MTPAPLRAFLIDDEPLALRRLARMLEATGRVEVVGRATDPEQGLRQIAARPVDVLFLDIHMPGLSGFQVVERVPPGPMVVFTWSAAATSPPAEGSARPSTAWPATSGPARSSTTSPRGCGTAST